MRKGPSVSVLNHKASDRVGAQHNVRCYALDKGWELLQLLTLCLGYKGRLQNVFHTQAGCVRVVRHLLHESRGEKPNRQQSKKSYDTAFVHACACVFVRVCVRLCFLSAVHPFRRQQGGAVNTYVALHHLLKDGHEWMQNRRNVCRFLFQNKQQDHGDKPKTSARHGQTRVFQHSHWNKATFYTVCVGRSLSVSLALSVSVSLSLCLYLCLCLRLSLPPSPLSTSPLSICCRRVVPFCSFMVWETYWHQVEVELCEDNCNVVPQCLFLLKCLHTGINSQSIEE